MARENGDIWFRFDNNSIGGTVELALRPGLMMGTSNGPITDAEAGDLAERIMAADFVSRHLGTSTPAIDTYVIRTEERQILP